MVNDIIMQKYVLLKTYIVNGTQVTEFIAFFVGLFWNHCLAAKCLKKLQLYIASSCKHNQEKQQMS